MLSYHAPCKFCKGHGKIKLAIGRRARRRYARRMREFEEGVLGGEKPGPLEAHMDTCKYCKATGLVVAEHFPEVDIVNYPRVAIIGGGIGGMALAVACLHRGIPYTLYERDESFDTRSQGYGLTLQQASKAMAGLGISDLEEGIISTRHVVHDTSGKIIGEWGRRQLSEEEKQKTAGPRNIHISRQGLRKKLFMQIYDKKNIVWGHRLKDISQKSGGEIELKFQVGDIIKTAKADLVVGADGIRSSVRNNLIGEEKSPLQYLGCIVILGICPLARFSEKENPLLDSATVFQTVNGHERIYMMPYDSETVMWQLSFPLQEEEAKLLSKKGPEILKQEGIRRLGNWHSPIPEILHATQASGITGYPVYDRPILAPEDLQDFGNITLMGDAMHPMSPFKGQGANQAILDALDLARDITTKCDSESDWREKGLRKIVLKDFEKQMLNRSSMKVRDSARVVKLLHSDAVLHDDDTPRGRGIG